MIYQKDLTIPINTPETAPASANLTAHPGRLTSLGLVFPRGCAGLARCRIYCAETQLWPSNPGGYFSGDGVDLQFAEDMRITQDYSQFRIEAWNLDDTFPHTITMRLTIQKEGVTLDDVLAALTVSSRTPMPGDVEDVEVGQSILTIPTEVEA